MRSRVLRTMFAHTHMDIVYIVWSIESMQEQISFFGVGPTAKAKATCTGLKAFILKINIVTASSRWERIDVSICWVLDWYYRKIIAVVYLSRYSTLSRGKYACNVDCSTSQILIKKYILCIEPAKMRWHQNVFIARRRSTCATYRPTSGKLPSFSHEKRKWITGHGYRALRRRTVLHCTLETAHRSNNRFIS